MALLFFALACGVLWLMAAPAHCDDNRYGYPTYRPIPRSSVFALAVLGDPNVYIIDSRPRRNRLVYDDYAYLPAPRVEPIRWQAAPCRMQGAFAVDWREECRSAIRKRK